jgi:hypothetical protein
MKTVRFISDDPKQKQFASEVRRKIAQYFKDNQISNKGNFTMYIKTVVMLALYLTPFVLLLTLNIPYWLAAVFVITMGIGEAGIGMCVMPLTEHFLQRIGSTASSHLPCIFLAAAFSIGRSNIIYCTIRSPIYMDMTRILRPKQLSG